LSFDALLLCHCWPQSLFVCLFVFPCLSAITDFIQISFTVHVTVANAFISADLFASQSRRVACTRYLLIAANVALAIVMVVVDTLRTVRDAYGYNAIFLYALAVVCVLCTAAYGWGVYTLYAHVSNLELQSPSSGPSLKEKLLPFIRMSLALLAVCVLGVGALFYIATDIANTGLQSYYDRQVRAPLLFKQTVLHAVSIFFLHYLILARVSNLHMQIAEFSSLQTLGVSHCTLSSV